MKLFSKEISDIDFDDIEEFAKEEIAENVCLDYKQQLSSKDGNLQIAKLACGFSNSLGGVILFGIKEKQLPDGRGIPEDLVGVDVTEQLEKRIKQVCMSNVSPPVLVETRSIRHRSIADREIIIARIPESDWTPHHLRSNNRVYVRTGDAAIIANEDGREESPDEIEWLLKRRQKAISFREELEARASCRCPAYQGRKLSSLSIVPLYPREELWSLAELGPILKGTDLLFDQDVSSANDSIYATRIDHDPGFWHTFAFLELNRFGLLFYCYEPRELPPTYLSPGDFPLCTDGLHFLHCLHLLLCAAKELYKSKSYWGLVKIEVKTDGVSGLQLHIPLRDDFYFGKCIDDRFSFSQTVMASEIANDDLIYDLYGRFRWCMGLGDRSFDQDALINQLAFVRTEYRQALPFRFFRRSR